MSADHKKYFKETRPLYKLKELASILRGSDGCPWDKEQTSKSLKPYLIEEAYEVYDAIENSDTENLREELGDLLYQVYAHSQIAGEEKLFDIDDVAEAIITKLIRRHPHVFSDEQAGTSHEVIANWEVIKQKEKEKERSILEGVPVHLPSLLKAYRVQQKASRAGFDWERIEDVEKKLDEELGELKNAIQERQDEKIFEEIGDMFFTLVNISRFLKVNPEEALTNTTKKFIDRFKFVEKEVKKSGKTLNESTLEELDSFWESAKKKEC